MFKLPRQNNYTSHNSERDKLQTAKVSHYHDHQVTRMFWLPDNQSSIKIKYWFEFMFKVKYI